MLNIITYVDNPKHIKHEITNLYMLFRWFDESQLFLVNSPSSWKGPRAPNRYNDDPWEVVENVEEVIRKGIDFVYPIFSRQLPTETQIAPRNIEWTIKDFSDEMIDAINSGQCNLVINDSEEGYPWLKEDVDEFKLLLMQYNINISKIIVLTSSWSYIYHSMPFRMVHFPYFECKTRIESMDTDTPRLPTAKKFLCLNRHNSPERFELIYQIHKNNMQNNFNFSYHGKVIRGAPDINGDKLSLITIEDDARYPQMASLFKWDSDREEFAKKTPFVYDYESFTVPVHNYDYIKNPLQHRKENYIFVVTETCFDQGGGYSGFLPNMNGGGHRDVSEKTWKPIGLKMPFILLQQPYALKRLRDIGYRTFHTIWDESYDEIEDEVKRFDAILNLIITLNNIEDFMSMIKSCDEIVEHNFKMLKLRRPEMHMIKELSTFLKD